MIKTLKFWKINYKKQDKLSKMGIFGSFFIQKIKKFKEGKKV